MAEWEPFLSARCQLRQTVNLDNWSFNPSPMNCCITQKNQKLLNESDRINCGVYILTPDIFNAIQGVSTQWKDRVEVFLSQLCAASPFCDSETVPSGLQAEWGHLCTDTDNTDIGSIFAFFVRKGCCGKLNWILLRLLFLSLTFGFHHMRFDFVNI
ncbi:hypothetical protein BC332_30856 [Capsicum chinense]|nr:hypothetical protein BC332_30856 [Capsicum chinense]